MRLKRAYLAFQNAQSRLDLPQGIVGGDVC
jgi:hypothetical protein